MLNVAIIMGRLTRDPELRRTGSGIAVASFTVAVDRDHTSEGQERETDFIDCVAWRGTAEFVEKYFKKGSMIALKGRLQIRSWTDKEGNKRKSAEIIADNVYFGESKKQDQGGNQSYGQNAFQGYQNQQPQGYGFQAPQNYQQPQYNAPQYNQQGFGGYQQGGYNAPSYQPPQGAYAPIEGDDPKLPF